MKTILKRTAAVFTAVAVAAACISICYAQRYNTINITGQNTSRISYSGAVFTRYTGNITYGSKTYAEKAYAVTAKPDIFTSVEVTSGDSIYGKSTLSQKISQYDAGEGRRVAAAINGDFFASSTGLPLGVQISNGQVWATNNYEYDKSIGRYSLAFRSDGSAFLGIPNLQVSASIEGDTIIADRLNAYPDTNLSMLTDKYSDKTYWNTNFAHDVIILKASSALSVDRPVTCSFVSYLTSVWEPITIQENHIYLIAPAGDSRLANAAAGKLAGAQASAAVTDLFGGGWADVSNALGAGNLLISGGVLRYTSTYDQSIANTMTSRSAVGIKADGTVVFYTVEKDRYGASSGGVTLEAVAQALFDMGCVDAVNLDGGGSSTIAASENAGECTVKNSCQDGAERRVSNALLLVCSETMPFVLEDFENDLNITGYSFGSTSITAKSDAQNIYSGNRSLKIDYSFSEEGNYAGFNFENDYDISKYSHIRLWIYGDGSGAQLYANLKSYTSEYKSSICKLDFTGWKNIEFNILGAVNLIGFHIIKASTPQVSGSFFIDRIVAYNGFSLTDTTAPNLDVSLDGSIISTYADDGVFSSGTDFSSLTCTVDGEPIAFTGNGFDISGVRSNVSKRAEIEITDMLGNRAKRTVIFIPQGYTFVLPYTDVDNSKWDSVYIRYCTERSIIDGFTENGVCTFRGSQSITRAQFCTMLVRRQKLDVDLYSDVALPYEDLQDIPAWSLPYVKAAYANGIMMGSKTYTGISFFASQNITRQEAACAVDRIATTDSRLCMPVNYNDIDQVSGWAIDAVSNLTAKGIFDGDNDGRFYPLRNLSRSESAAVISRII